MDPLYAQYQKPQGKCTKRFPCTNFTPYPLVDPRRMRLGKGTSFRTQYSMCPDGWIKRENNMCYPIVEKKYGFYEKKNIGFYDVKPFLPTSGTLRPY